MLYHVLTLLSAQSLSDSNFPEAAYYGHLVLRLMACFVLYYTTRVIYQGQVTMDEIVFNLKHHWSSVDCQELELYGLS